MGGCFLLVGVLLYGFEIPYAFGYADEGVCHVLLVLEAEGAFVAHFTEHLDETGEVDGASSQLDGVACLGAFGDVLQMDVEDAFAVSLQVFDGVGTCSQVMADIETDAQPRVAILDVVPNGGGVGIERHIRPMQMDGIANASLLDFLLHAVEHIVARSFVAPNAWNAHNEVHANSLSISKSLIDGLYIFHINRSDGISDDIVSSQLLLELAGLLGTGIDGQVEVLDTEVVDVNLLHEGECLVDVELHECVACHAKMESILSPKHSALKHQQKGKK